MNELLSFIPAWQFMVFAAIFGAMWGSFANVVIHRWPICQSVVRPASHCTSCGKPIRFYDNIPIFSYIILGGRCRDCKASFSPRYAIVELCMALLSVAVMKVTLLADPPSFLFGLTQYFVWFAFVWSLVTVGIIDLETFLLPDVIILPGIAVGILVNWLVLKNGWLDYVIAAAGGYAAMALPFVHGYRLLTGKTGMGEGDPKLVAMIGAFLGIEGALFAVCVGAFQGLVVGSMLVVYRRRTGANLAPPVPDEDIDAEGKEMDEDPRFRKAKVPFGPFLALGTLEYFFFGERLIEIYTGGMGRLMGLFY